MAITNYKKVEDSKGYFLNDKDRKIFEREVSRGFFGNNVGDTIEFIIYDSNDNPLPQASAEGNTVRYIEYNDKNYQEYFLKTQINKNNLSSNNSEEFFIDTEKLLKEAGYTQGVFKTSITLLNRRIGSELKQNDNVWIHEISPSRTEIRVLPTVDTNGQPNKDLQSRYQSFTDGKIFTSDVYPFLDEFAEQFDVEKVIKEMYGIKGRTQTGVNYVKLIQSEFKIQDFDKFITRIRDKYTQAIKYFKLNCVYDINSPLFGQPNKTAFDLSYTDSQILNTAIEIITQCIEYYLPKRNINDQVAYTEEEQQTLDELQVVRETLRDGGVIKTQVPPTSQEPIVGCMDPNALNYNPNATVDDRRLCIYSPTKVPFQKLDDPQIDIASSPPPPPPPPPPIPVDPPPPPTPVLPVVTLSDRPKPVDEVPEPISVPTPKPKPLPVISLSDRERRIEDRLPDYQDRIDRANLGSGGQLNPLAGIELDLSNRNEAALAQIVTDTFKQVNPTATQDFFEDLNNAGLVTEEIIPAETGGTITITADQFKNMSSNTRINLGSTVSGGSVVLDKNIRRRDINQL